MSEPSQSGGDSRIDEILADYFLRLDHGETVDRDAFVAEHPEHATELLAFFDDASAVGLMIESVCGKSATASNGTDEDLLTAGRSQLGEYQLLERIGCGGMGVVYKARHSRLMKVLAIKVLSRDRMSDALCVARFHREMRAAGRLEHPNVVRATDAGEIDGIHFLAMEYVDGVDLATLAARNQSIGVADACELMRQTAIGLQAAHEMRLVHRDIKPSNLMLTGEGQVKILDMGLARLGTNEVVNDELTREGQMLGTADFMAPEQASDSQSVDIRADVYSLGCTLYRLLAGRNPFFGPQYNTPFRKALAHAQEPVPPIRELVPVIPGPLAEILDKMLAKKPEDRFATPGEVAEALAPFAEGSDLQQLSTRAIQGENHDETNFPTQESRLLETRREEENRPGRPRHAGRATGHRVRVAAAVIAILLGSLGVFGLLSIVTDNGTLEIRTHDPNIEVIVLDGGEQVRVVDRKTGMRVKLHSGEYTLTLSNNEGGLRLSTDRFVLTRGETVVAEVIRAAANDRGIAEWIFKSFAHPTVDVETESRCFRAKGVAQLPKQPCYITLIDLQYNAFTEKDIQKIGGLSRLRELRLFDTGLTDAGLAAIRPMPSLEVIHLQKTRVSDTGLEHLSHFQNLREVGLSHTGITDAGLLHLKNLHKLESLTLCGTRITDRGLDYLKGLKRLKKLDISGTAATSGAISHLEATLPKCRVTVAPGPLPPRRMIQIEPTNVPAWTKLLLSEFERGASAEEMRILFEKAEVAVGRAQRIEFLNPHAAWALMIGDRAEYEKVCRAAAAEYTNSTDPRELNLLAFTAALTNKPILDTKQVVEIAERVVAADPDRWLFQHTLGLCLLRNGQTAAAIEQFNDFLGKWGDMPNVWLCLVIAHAEQGQAGQAQDWLKKAQQWFRRNQNPLDSTSTLPPTTRMECILLLREIEQLNIPKLPEDDDSEKKKVSATREPPHALADNSQDPRNWPFMEIAHASVELHGGCYVFSVETADLLPDADDMSDGKRVDYIWAVDIDRDPATGQSDWGNDYNIHVFLDKQGWHSAFYRVSDVTQNESLPVNPDDTTVNANGKKVVLSFPDKYLASQHFAWRVNAFGNKGHGRPCVSSNHTTRRIFKKDDMSGDAPEPAATDASGYTVDDTEDPRNWPFMEIVDASVALRGDRYVFSMEAAGPFPAATDMAGGKRVDYVWGVDIDRNSQTGQTDWGNDYHVHAFLDERGWHPAFFQVSELAQKEIAPIGPDDFKVSSNGKKVAVSFAAGCLPSKHFAWRANATTINGGGWPRVIGKHTEREIFKEGMLKARKMRQDPPRTIRLNREPRRSAPLPQVRLLSR